MKFRPFVIFTAFLCLLLLSDDVAFAADTEAVVLEPGTRLYSADDLSSYEEVTYAALANMVAHFNEIGIYCDMRTVHYGSSGSNGYAIYIAKYFKWRFSNDSTVHGVGTGYLAGSSGVFVCRYSFDDLYRRTNDLLEKVQFWGSTINSNVYDIVTGVTSLVDKMQFWGSTINDNVNALNDTRSILNSTNSKIDSWSSIINDNLVSLNDTRSIIAITNTKLEGVQTGIAALTDKLNFWSSTINDNIVSLNDTRSIVTVTNERLYTIISLMQTIPGDSACEHTYTAEPSQEATCILPGLLVYTCPQCGDTYSEITPALGHDWQCSDHVEEVKDPDTGEVTQSGYDIYTCSRCGDTYKDFSGAGAPEDDYGNTSIAKLVVRLFSKLGTFFGKLVSFVIGLFDKALSGVDLLITRFNDLTVQITGFGGDYPTWLSGFWDVLPSDLQLALTFSFLCLLIGVIGKKLVFS